MPEIVKASATVTWWEDALGAEWSPEPEDVSVSIGFEDETLIIDGLRDGYYLAIPLKALGEAIALGTRP